MDSIEELYEARIKRVKDAIALTEPDQVPIVSPVQKFVYDYAGITMREAMYEYDKTKKACKKFAYDFKPDMDFGPWFALPGKVLEITDLKWLRWPGGGGLDDNNMYQFIEDEYMKADEYDDFNFDMTHFLLTKWLPRSVGNAQGLANFPVVRNAMWFGWFPACLPFASEELQQAFETLRRAGEELGRYYQFIGEYFSEVKEEAGIPPAAGSFAWTPYDLVGDTLRGTEGILMDMYDRPEQLEEAVEKMIPIGIDMGVQGMKASGNPFCWIWLHKGMDNFMSDEYYERFYWKSFKKMIEGMVAEGVVPMIYGEGPLRRRVKFFAELPKGTCMIHFEEASIEDMKIAKETLRDVACISGNLPNLLFSHGTPEEIKDYTKKLIDVCGEGGGYIMDTSALLDEAKVENVQAWFETTREYGRYS
jgi:uroporphyrinogen-III decarboxylase